MTAKAIELDGKRYVILPEEEYEAILQARNGHDDTVYPDDPMTEEEERALIEMVERSRKEPAEPYDQVRKELGLA